MNKRGGGGRSTCASLDLHPEAPVLRGSAGTSAQSNSHGRSLHTRCPQLATGIYVMFREWGKTGRYNPLPIPDSPHACSLHCSRLTRELLWAEAPAGPRKSNSWELQDEGQARRRLANPLQPRFFTSRTPRPLITCTFTLRNLHLEKSALTRSKLCKNSRATM